MRKTLLSFGAFALLTALAPVWVMADITAIVRTGASTGCAPVLVAGGLNPGAAVYCDRVHVWSEVPVPLRGITVVQTDNDDRTQVDLGYQVTVEGPGLLILFLDNRIGRPAAPQFNQYRPYLPGPGAAGVPNSNMQWVIDGGWTDTGTDIGIDEGNNGDTNQFYSVFTKAVPAGSNNFQLGPQNAGGINDYLIGFKGNLNDLADSVAPNGWIPTNQWNHLYPLTSPRGCNGGGPAFVVQNWVAPHDMTNEDPAAGDEWDDIDYTRGLLSGWGARQIVPDATWVTTPLLETFFSIPAGTYPNQDLVDYNENFGVFLSNTVLVPNGLPALVNDNVLGISTSYVENTTGQNKTIEICTASDDLIVVYINQKLAVLAGVACRGSAGDCQERNPAILPPGISKITVLVWEGGGGHNFRLRLIENGQRVTDTSGHGIRFLGPTGTTQQQYDVTRTLVGDPTLCVSPDKVSVNLKGSGPGAAGDVMDVIETVAVSGAGSSISNINPAASRIDELNGAAGASCLGFAEELLFLGPISMLPCPNANCAGPGDAFLQAIQIQSLSDPTISEDNPAYQPADGDLVPDNVLPMSTANCGQCANINPGSVLRWNLRRGIPNFDFNPNYYGGDVNDNIVAVATYFCLAQDTNVYVGLGSDDSWTVRIDGAVVGIRNIPRGYGNANEIQDFIGPFALTAGKHFLLMKIYEGGGGHGGRIGLFNADRTPLTGVSYSADPDADFCGDTRKCGDRITWEDLTRAQVNSGLSYDIEADTGSNVNLTFSGIAVGQAIIGGANTGLVEGVAFTGPVGVFDNSRVIGAPPTAGSFSQAGGVYSLTASGFDFWDGGDTGRFAYKQVTGDFDAKMRLTGHDVPPANSRWGKHGIMARYDCSGNSAHGMTQNNLATQLHNPGEVDLPRFAYRSIHRTNGTNRDWYNVDDNMLPGYPATGDPDIDRHPQWHRLVRMGDTLYGYMSYADAQGNPIEWCNVGTNTFYDMPDTIFVGAALTAHSSGLGEEGTIRFDTFTIDPVAPPAELVATPGATILDVKYEQADGSTPGDNAFIAQRGGTHKPQVQGNRLRLLEHGVPGSATAVWYEVSDSILANGFVAEFDAYYFDSGLPGDANPADGGGFNVQAGVDPYLNPPVCNAGTGVIEEFDQAGFIGTDVGGGSSGSVDAAGVYTNISTSNGDLWDGCDDFMFQYAGPVAGDFDVAIQFLERFHPQPSNDLDDSRWGKFGLMARQSLTRQSRFSMIQDHLPDLRDGARAAGRRVHETNCVSMYEVGTSIAHPTYFRLTRRGNVVQAWFSDAAGLGDGTLDPHNDCNWIPGHAENWGEAPDVYVGFANSEHNSGPADTQRIMYRILGDNGGAVNTPDRLTDHAGDGGGAYAYWGGPMLARTECHPSFSIEADLWSNGDDWIQDQGDASPNNDGRYHLGLNVWSNIRSVQTNDRNGVPTNDLPNIFDPAGVHFRVEYLPNGNVDVFVKGNAGGPELHALSRNIPPLTVGAGAGVGFSGGTGGESVRAEFDNLLITELCTESADSVTIAGDTTSEGTANVSATAGGADGPSTYTWSIVSDTTGGAVLTPAGANASVTATNSGEVTVKVVAGDGKCADEASDEHTITFNVGVGPFRRGDCNGDGSFEGSVTDMVFLANYNFTGGATPPCRAACDFNGDGAVEGSVSDIIAMSEYLFLGTRLPAQVRPPFGDSDNPECANSSDQRDRNLGCDVPTCP